MKNIIVLFLVVLLNNYSCFIKGMESSIEYRQANNDDIKAIVKLINKQAFKDSDKIVIVPELFRTSYIQDSINSGRLFVAVHNKAVIGYKKLFCITDQKECNDILNNELRCKEDNLSERKLACIPDLNTEELLSEDIIKLHSLPITYIYNGADFTHPDYRAKGINTYLTQHAFKVIVSSVLEQSKSQQATHIALVYGLTRMNAGNENILLDGRTRNILRQFIPFTKKITTKLGCTQPSHFIISRYSACKPSFDPKATECKPLSDGESIPGYGYLVACPLDQNSYTKE